MTLVTIASTAHAGGYAVTPLVTDDQAVLATLGYGAAPTTDTALVNPWDFANAGTGAWVVANTGANGGGVVAGTATSYSGAGQITSPTISIPQAVGPAHGGMTGPVGPTGDVYAGGAGFTLPGGASAQYIFSNLDGSISGWDGSSASAQTLIAGRGPGGNLAAYTGLEIDTYNGQNLLYAPNNITGNIDVFNTALAPVTLPGAFVDPGPNPGGLLPFNIQALSDGHLWVTYAVPGPPASGQSLGSGFVSEFNTDGTFVKRFATGGLLDSPWGVAIAPSNFGAYSNDVLIGNFNDNDGLGYITAYDPNTRRLPRARWMRTARRSSCPACGRCSSAAAASRGRPTNSTSPRGSAAKTTACSARSRPCRNPGHGRWPCWALGAVGLQMRARRRLAV